MANNYPIVSVVVPVYKAEKYIDRCVESVVKQTYRFWELLLVDDGSPDNSGLICECWAKKDNRIKVLHKKNGGVCSARNLGIENASGKWITFIDADDAIESDTLSKCSAFFDKEDVVRFSMKYVYSKDGEVYSDMLLSDMSRTEYISKVISRETILGVCGCLYRTSIFIDNNIRFNTSLISGEDWVVLFQALLNANTIKVLPNPSYLYSKYNENSATYSFRYIYARSTLDAYHCIKSLLDELNSVPSFDNELAQAKSKLVYNFAAHSILSPSDIRCSEFDDYVSNGGWMNRKEINQSKVRGKAKILLVLFSFSFFRNCLRKRLKK